MTKKALHRFINLDLIYLRSVGNISNITSIKFIRATDLGEETQRLRPPRFLNPDGLVRPYNKNDAVGNKLLNRLEKGKYASTDVYIAHYDVIERKELLLLTDKRVVYVTRNSTFGGWQVSRDFMYPRYESTKPNTVGYTVGFFWKV